MQFIDLRTQQGRIRERIEENLKKVLDHGQYIMGPEIGELEERLASYVGVKNAISCASGTDALLMALMAYDVGPGDAVFTTPFTFIATAEVIGLLGATPVFVDIDPRTFNIDASHFKRAVDKLKGKGGTSPLAPKGIIPVDLFGLPADYDEINSIAKENGLFVIEDAAQSFGGEYRGRRSCALGDIGCTSFFPAKPLGAYGDGGMCFTASGGLADKMRSIRVHGKGGHKYDNVRIGINGRLDTLQAAILLAKFEIFPDEVKLRQAAAERYAELLGGSSLIVPAVPEGCSSVWAQYSLLAESSLHREECQRKFKEAGIPTAVYYPKPLHLQEAFRNLSYKKGDFPVSEDVASRIFSVPMHPYLTREDQKRIADTLFCTLRSNPNVQKNDIPKENE